MRITQIHVRILRLKHSNDDAASVPRLRNEMNSGREQRLFQSLLSRSFLRLLSAAHPVQPAACTTYRRPHPSHLDVPTFAQPPQYHHQRYIIQVQATALLQVQCIMEILHTKTRHRQLLINPITLLGPLSNCLSGIIMHHYNTRLSIISCKGCWGRFGPRTSRSLAMHTTGFEK